MISDELLIAFADGALEGEELARVAAAVEADPALAEHVERQLKTRQELRAAFAGQLDLAPPARMMALFEKSVSGGGKVLPFPNGRERRPSVAIGWAAAAAACLALAFVAGRASEPTPLVRMNAERGLIADGALELALNNEPSGGGGPVRVTLSFPQKDGGFCRVFSAGQDTGLACNAQGDWGILAMTSAPQDQGAGLHKAAGAVPEVIMDTANERRSGDPLDASGEKAAISKSWR
jgi:hypothetical protein